MSKAKLGLGLSAVAAAFIMAFSSTPDAKAEILRETSNPSSPIVSYEDCDTAVPDLCAYEFTNSNQLIGPYEGKRTSN